MIYVDKMHQLTNALHNDGLVLLPTRGLWSIACNMQSPLAYNKLLQLKKNVSDYPITIMVNSVEMLKHYFPNIHPRIETLLYYFERPISIIYADELRDIPDYIANEHKSITVRLAQEPLCTTLIDLMSEPIIVSSARDNTISFPRSFGDIGSQILRNMDYICRHRAVENGFEPEVIIQYDQKGDLTFIRE